MKPAFNANLPFEVIEKPAFNPSLPFEEYKEPLINKYVKREETAEEKTLKLIQDEIGKIRIPKSVTERIVEKQIIKEVEKKDDKKYAESKTVENLVEEIKKLQKIVNEQEKIIKFDIANRGGSGVIGVPNPEGHGGQYLTVQNGQIKWTAVSAGGGGTSPDVYTTAGVTTTRTLNPTTSTIDDLYNVVASLIVSLQGAGIIQ